MACILHLDDAASWRGGQQQVLYLHQGLLAAGVDSRVLCQEGGALHERLASGRLPHYAMRLHGGHDLLAARRIGQLCQQEDALLHAHTSHAHDLALWASRLAGRMPLVVSRRVDFVVGSNALGRRKYGSRRVDRYLAISSAVERELRAAGIAGERIRRIPSGIDFSRFDSVVPRQRWREELGVASDELLFCNVAALAPHKDQSTMLRAFARYRAQGGRGRLVILGDGELRSQLEALRHELDLDRDVQLPGFVDDPLPRLAAADIFVLSSKEEGLGTSILDAMALGRCVLATRAGGIVDAVRDGEDGLLVAPQDPEAMADAMRRLADQPALRRRLADRARERVRDFDVRRTVELTLASYRELLGDRL